MSRPVYRLLSTRIVLITAWLGAAGLQTLAIPRAPQAGKPLPSSSGKSTLQGEPGPLRQGMEGASLAIESFASARAYVVGSETVTLVATLRNTGKEPLPAGLATARLYCLSGLDYTEGDTRPKLPALEPNATTTFRWRVQPTNSQAPLVASVAIDAPGRSPDTRVLVIQRFAETPSAVGENPNTAKLPSARAGDSRATLENATLRVRIETTAANLPVLFLSSHSAAGWRKIGVSLPLAEVLSAEGGQAAWWEVFKAEEIRAVNEKNEASLVISGGFGLRWRATVRLTLRLNSSILDAKLLLAPLKSVKLSGLRLLPFLIGDGSFGSAKEEQIQSDSEVQSRLAAVRWGPYTIGAVWQETPLFPDWQSTSLPNVSGADYRLLGMETRTGTIPVALTPAGMVEARARLFVLTPSLSVEDARRIPAPKGP